MWTSGTIARIFLFGLFLLLTPQKAHATLCYTFSQIGFSGGGSVSGSFCGNDLDSDGILNSFAVPTSEITSYSMSFSGSPSALVFPFSHTITDFATAGAVGGLIYVLGSPFLGDLFVSPFEGIASGPLGGIPGLTTFAYRTGMGPTGINSAFGFVEDNNQNTTAIDNTSSYVVVTSVPEPSTLALFGIGLFGLAALRRRRKA